MTIGYLVVIILDNLLVWHTNKTISHQVAGDREGSVDGGVGVAYSDAHGKYEQNSSSEESRQGSRAAEHV